MFLLCEKEKKTVNAQIITSLFLQISEGESLRFRVKFYPPHPDIQLKASGGANIILQRQCKC